MRKFRLYYDKDAEEVWLQKMAHKGWAVKQFALGMYTFEPCRPGEYVYRIDLMPDDAKDQHAFTSFMEEVGVEFVCRWNRWVYLRRKAAEGPFELYTDAESLIAQYSRIRRFFGTVLGLEVLCLLMEAVAASHTNSPILWGFTGLILLLTVVISRVVIQCSRKINALKKV